MMRVRINSLTLITIIFATASKHVVASPSALSHNVPSRDASTRIIGGSRAVAGQFPYFAGLMIEHEDEDKNKTSTICGGSLIGLTTILTAAHCVDGAKLITIVLGATSFAGHEPTKQVFYSNRKQYILHPDYRKRGLKQREPLDMDHDIAIVKLNETVKLSDHVKIIPTAPTYSHDFAGSSSTMMGFGLTSDTDTGPHLATLKYETSYILSNDDCKKQSLTKSHIVDRFIRETHICQKTRGGIFLGGRKAPCYGDSGGPLVVDGVQVGIFSFTTNMCEKGFRSVYERTSSYYKWIKRHSEIIK